MTFISCLPQRFFLYSVIKVPSFSLSVSSVNYFKHLKVGETASIKQRITEHSVDQFASLSGDTNPIHLDKASAVSHSSGFENRVVHGAFLNSLVSRVIGTILPGPGTVVVKQTLNFPSPCYVGEEVLVKVTVQEIRKISTLLFECSVECHSDIDLGQQSFKIHQINAVDEEKSETRKKIVLFGDAKVILK